MAHTDRRISLNPQEFARLDNAAGKVIHVMRGRLWITQENEAADHVLEAGSSFTVSARGRTLVGALQRSVFHVCVPQVAPCGLDLPAAA